MHRFLPKTCLLLLLFSSVSFSQDRAIQTVEKLVIGIATWGEYPKSTHGFKEVLAQNGYIENENVIYLERSALTNKEAQIKIAEEFKLKQVNLIYSLTTPGTIIMKEIMPASTPIVFSIVTYPADSGLIESYEYSANNLVGTSNYISLDYSVNLIQMILPSSKKVAIFRRKGEPNSKLQAVSLIRKLTKAGINVIDVEAESIAQLEQKALDLGGMSIDAFITTTDTLLQKGGEAALIKVAKRLSIPVVSSNKKGIESGASFGPVADFAVLGRMSGEMAVEILRSDTQPFDLASKLMPEPIILINKTSMDELGIKIPKLQNAVYVK